jgi:hypothetical protein
MRGQSLSVAAITGGTAQFSDGAAATPSISFASTTGVGFWNAGSNNIGISLGGVCSMKLGGGGFVGGSASVFGWTSGTDPTGSSLDTSLSRGAAGVIKFASAASFSANGSVATTMTSLGPTGSHTTIQTWLTIQDSGGTTRYIPCY